MSISWPLLFSPTQPWKVFTGPASPGYSDQLLSDSAARQLPDHQLYIGQYTKVKLLRLMVDVEGSCNFSSLYCHRTDPDREHFGHPGTGADGNSAPMPSGLWQRVPSPPQWAYGPGAFYYITLFNTSNALTSKDDIKKAIEGLAQDVPFVARYAISLQLEVVATYDMEFEPDRCVSYALRLVFTKDEPRS